MSLCAIIPIKSLHNGKSRLAEVLPEAERVFLNAWLYQNTLSIVSRVKGIAKVLVVSKDTEVQAYAKKHNALVMSDDGVAGLNAALSRAIIFARIMDMTRILILPADLPLITVEDLQTFLDRGLENPQMVIAPDRHRHGTNALMVSPPNLIPLAFGPDSFTRHRLLCKTSGATFTIDENPRLALDLDFPDDLNLMEKTYHITLNDLINQPIDNRLAWRM